MQYLIGLIGALFAGLFYYKTKAKSATSLLENNDVKREILKDDEAISHASGNIKSQQENIKSVQDNMDAASKEKLGNEDLAKFFNNIKPKS